MQTQCPNCHTVFRITQTQLNAAEGLVRCGECGDLFNASGTLADGPEQDDSQQENLALDFTPDTGERPVARFFLNEMSREQQQAQQPRRSRKALAWVAVLLLALAVFQVLYSQRDALAAISATRPAIESLCVLMGCELGPQRDLDRIELINRNVYSHPNISGALIISATLVNNAGFTQPYPVLAVSMANVRGKTLVQRDFQPGDYLSPEDAAAGMTPGAPVSVALQVVDPGAEAMTFELDFR